MDQSPALADAVRTIRHNPKDDIDPDSDRQRGADPARGDRLDA
jgi:hypothetical protein